MKKAVDQVRLDVETALEDPRGRLFIDPISAALTDLSGVRILRCGVDTVRQLYRGMVRPDVLCLFEEPGMVDFAGFRWHSGRVGRDSGYQYKLQNADLGLVLLVKNFNSKLDAIGPHLKIEVSPHTIESMTHDDLQKLMDSLAREVLIHMERNQCAVHLALDVQGWVPMADLSTRMHCKARAQREISGISEISWAAKASVYGRGETFMFGSANGIQLSIYNKTEQAKAIDKLDYWEAVWSRSDNPFDDEDPANYQSEQAVWRIELRFHHSVVQQFAEGSASTATGDFISTDSYADLVPHLDGLWSYGVSLFRLLSRPGVYDAFWSLIRMDVRVSVPVPSLLDQTHYKRYYKTSRGFSGKNVDLFMGNFISLLARERVGAKKAMARLQEWECWPVIRDHYAAKGKDGDAIYKHVKDLLEERSVRWGRAV